MFFIKFYQSQNKWVVMSPIAHLVPKELTSLFIDKINTWVYNEYFMHDQFWYYLPNQDMECIVKFSHRDPFRKNLAGTKKIYISTTESNA